MKRKLVRLQQKRFRLKEILTTVKITQKYLYICNNDSVDIIFVGLSQRASLVDMRTHEDTGKQTNGVSSTGENKVVGDTAGLLQVSSRVASTTSSPFAGQFNPVALVRKRTLWDDESQAYLSQWECRTKDITTNPPEPEFFQTSTKKLEGIFALRWERKQMPRTAAWTSDALRSDSHVLGRLEVIFPWVLLAGEQCVEVGDIISKHTFKLRQ